MNRGRIRVAVGFLALLGAAAALTLALSVISGQSAMARSGDAQPRAPYEGWTARAPMPTGRNLPAAAVVSGTVYVFGGWQGEDLPGTTLTVTEAYSPAADSWVARAGMASDRNALAAAVVDGAIYAIGGWSSEDLVPTSTVEVYHPATDSWSPVAPLPAARNALAAAAVDGEIYVFGGWDSTGITNAVTAYNPVSDTWRICNPMPTARNGLTTVAVDGEIYVIGGSPGPLTVTGKVEIYDPAADSWRTGAEMPTPRWLMSAAVMDGSIYVVGGNALGDFGTPLAVNEVYDPATDTWTDAAPLPTARWGMGVGVVDGRLYAIGGASIASGWDTVNEVYHPLAPTRVLLPFVVKSTAP